jgi:hypothetical protein
VSIIWVDNTGSSTTLETFAVCTVGTGEWGFAVAGQLEGLWVGQAGSIVLALRLALLDVNLASVSIETLFTETD